LRSKVGAGTEVEISLPMVPAGEPAQFNQGRQPAQHEDLPQAGS
jgi:hypothetical protein